MSDKKILHCIQTMYVLHGDAKERGDACISTLVAVGLHLGGCEPVVTSIVNNAETTKTRLLFNY